MIADNALHMRLFGIDFGDARVGVALGDTESRIASPWAVISEPDRLALLARLHDMAQRDLVEGFVVGIPRPLKDSSQQNKQVLHVKKFVEDLKRLSLPVYEEDEAMSSQLAARQSREQGEKGKRDDLAAAVILQSWFDRKG